MSPIIGDFVCALCGYTGTSEQLDAHWKTHPIMKRALHYILEGFVPLPRKRSLRISRYGLWLIESGKGIIWSFPDIDKRKQVSP